PGRAHAHVADLGAGQQAGKRRSVDHRADRSRDGRGVGEFVVTGTEGAQVVWLLGRGRIRAPSDFGADVSIATMPSWRRLSMTKSPSLSSRRASIRSCRISATRTAPTWR